jgi:serine/threonine protein kinase
MKEKGYCHCDIKPANTQFVKCEDSENAFTLKLIDFGGVTINKLKYKVYTPAFFNNPQRKYS